MIRTLKITSNKESCESYVAKWEIMGKRLILLQNHKFKIV